MALYRLRVKPLSPWCTPWQADTLFGLLCWMCARTRGDDAVRELLIQPCLKGEPPFVLSDACPGEYLPAPVWLRCETTRWEPRQRKQVNKARWIEADDFGLAQAGFLPSASSLSRDGGIREQFELHNLLGRSSNTTGDGGELFPLSGHRLAVAETLSIYVRADQSGSKLFFELMRELATFGFGAEASSGKGEFEIPGDLEPADWLDAVTSPNAVIVLSTFQPGSSDPTQGYWETFLKYGKLGPDFGVENVFKRPLILLRPGACFRCSTQLTHVGRAIPMQDLFSPQTVAELSARHCEVIHSAFGLAIPAVWPRQ